MNFKRIVSLVLTICMLLTIASFPAMAVSPTYAETSTAYKNSVYYTNLMNVSLTGNQAQDIVNIARSQIGYKGGSTTVAYNGNGDLKEADAMGRTYSEYGRWYYETDTPSSWCATFILWCARRANIANTTIKDPSGAAWDYVGSEGAHFGVTFIGRDEAADQGHPKVGDIIYFSWDGKADSSNKKGSHVGLVSYVNDSKTQIKVVHGNYSKRVQENTLDITKSVTDAWGNIDYDTIWGYGVPNYSGTGIESSNPAPSEPTTPSDPTTSSTKKQYRYGRWEPVGYSWAHFCPELGAERAIENNEAWKGQPWKVAYYNQSTNDGWVDDKYNPVDTGVYSCGNASHDHTVNGKTYYTMSGSVYKWDKYTVDGKTYYWREERTVCVVHDYSNDCDTTCNREGCGATRTVSGHKYDNPCDTTCNICNATRTVSGHKYDNDCDTSCNNCGATRSITHKYDNACDTSCNVCGVTRTTTHTYDNSSDATCNVCGATRNIAVTSVSLNKTTATLNVGESVTLTATVAPTTATNKTVSWSSSNTNVATVSNGKVTAKSAGTATITVTTADGNKTVTCTVTVKNPVLASGTCGDNVTWSLSDKGNLTLSGSGDTYDYESNIDVPWYSYIDSIKTIEITGAVTSIGDYLFYGMSNVERGISIPDTVTSIGYRAYSKCLNVKSITIPDSVTLIGEEAFFDCKGLTEIVVDENNEYYSSVQGVLFNKEKTTLIQYPISRTATSYTIPDSVISIDRLAFYCCPFLTSITIPDGVTSIGAMAFHCCSSLTSIIIPNSMTSIGDYAFYWCDVLADVYYGGTEEQKMAISIGRENSCLTNATWHFTLCDNGHTYNNACDASCNVCGETRTTTHKYDNACDAKCNVCNTTRTVGSHVYDGEYDIRCNECGNKKGVVNRSTPIDILRQLYTQVNPSQLPNFSEEEWTFYYDILVARGWSATAAQTEIDYHKAEIAKLKVQAEDPTWVSPDYSRNIIIDNCIKYEKSTSSCIYVSGYTWNLLAGLDVDSFSIRGPISLPNSELREQVENSVDDMYVTFHKGIDYDSTNVVTDQNYYFLVRTKFLASSADYSPNLYKGYDAVRRGLNDDSISPVIFRLDWYNWASNPFTGGQLTVKLTEDWVNNYGDNAVSVYRIDGYRYTQDNDPILVPVKQNTAIEDTETREVTFDVKGAQRLYDSYAIVNTNKSVTSTTHVYDNDCDTDCNECGATRVTEHKYDNACDAECNVCGTTRTVGEHVYDNDKDTTCNECGDIREVAAPDIDMPAFVVENKTAKVGDTFTVDVSIKNNSGIISLRNYIGYDSNILELVSATAGDNFSDTSFGPTTKNPFNIIWDDSLASSNNTTNGVVATLTFKVKEGVEACDTEITLTYKSEDVYDFDWNNVEFGVENGTITVIDYIPGDVNGDGNVNNKDMGLLRRWLNDWDVEIDELASDVNRDGNVNNKDLGLLRRYLNDWDVELK